jgi:prepilin-type N-terminal cleavage/methylation domain-containing protein
MLMPLSIRIRAPRHGVTLIELIVALVVGGIVLALVAAISVRQQRLYADIADRTALAAQLRQAATILPIDLRGAASGAGDIREARDTSIELRGTIASAVICDTTANAIVLSPSNAGATTFGSYLTSIVAADTAWIFTPGDSVDRWVPYAIAGTAATAAGQCATTGPQLNATARASSRVSLQLVAPPSFAGLAGSVIRVTRPVRYSLYRGGDGRWYLGQREWNASSLRFNTIQPVSGPFESPAGRGLVFQYSDTAGTLLATPVADPRAIVLVRVDLQGQSRNVMRALGAGSLWKSIDSVHLVVSLRNRH